MNIKELPQIPTFLAREFEAWIVGTAADPNSQLSNIKDIDVVVPFSQWARASKIISLKEPSCNKYGGWKIIDEGIVVDIWPDDITHVLTSGLVNWIW